MPAWFIKKTSRLFTLIASLIFVAPAIGQDTIMLEFGVISIDNYTAVVHRYMRTLTVLGQSMTAILDRTVDIRMKIVSEQNELSIS
ncbi:MAG: hypothetical protein ACJA0Z_000167 [Halioglobus sp.]|jgi:hypothetical protein